MSKLFFAEFFAGGGMARLGFGPGWTCALANDIKPHKAASYRANFGADHLRVCDVATLTSRDIPGVVDCCWLSPPCVGHSEAGDRRGFAEKELQAFWPRMQLSERWSPRAGAADDGVRETSPAFVGEPARRRGGVQRRRLSMRDPDRRRPFFRSAEPGAGVRRRRACEVSGRRDPGPLFERAMAALPKKRSIDLECLLEVQFAFHGTSARRSATASHDDGRREPRPGGAGARQRPPDGWHVRPANA